MENDLVDLDELDKLIKEVSKNKKQKNKTSNFDDFDDLLNINNSPGLNQTNLELSKIQISKKSNSNVPPEAKCFPYCYATSDEIGISKYNRIRSCSSLRCTSCDFDIVWFDRSKWSAQVDYIFLRNNHPNKKKLKIKIDTATNSRAFCCQCKSITVQGNLKLTISNSNWVCGKH
jgi:hypothetical protein